MHTRLLTLGITLLLPILTSCSSRGLDFSDPTVFGADLPGLLPKGDKPFTLDVAVPEGYGPFPCVDGDIEYCLVAPHDWSSNAGKLEPLESQCIIVFETDRIREDDQLISLLIDLEGTRAYTTPRGIDVEWVKSFSWGPLPGCALMGMDQKGQPFACAQVSLDNQGTRHKLTFLFPKNAKYWDQAKAEWKRFVEETLYVPIEDGIHRLELRQTAHFLPGLDVVPRVQLAVPRRGAAAGCS